MQCIEECINWFILHHACVYICIDKSSSDKLLWQLTLNGLFFSVSFVSSSSVFKSSHVTIELPTNVPVNTSTICTPTGEDTTGTRKLLHEAQKGTFIYIGALHELAIIHVTIFNP